MSDINRAHFDTIGDKKSSNITKSVKTMRFELNLFEPNVDSFPQFNYSTLARMEKVMYVINIIFFFAFKWWTRGLFFLLRKFNRISKIRIRFEMEIGLWSQFTNTNISKKKKYFFFVSLWFTETHFGINGNYIFILNQFFFLRFFLCGTLYKRVNVYVAAAVACLFIARITTKWARL